MTTATLPGFRAATRPVRLTPPTSRFVTLDAMRGVAALMVVALHYGSIIGGWSPRSAFLAVDLFFVLSGFVISRAYESRLAGGLSRREFISKRVVRLWPLMILGVAISAIVKGFIRPDHSFTGLNFFGSLAFASLDLPSPLASAGFDGAFPFDLPIWSLCFEFWVANLLYAFAWRHLHGRTLVGVLVVSALALFAAIRIYHSVDAGYTWPTLWIGLVRVLFSFCAGIGLYKVHQLYGARIPRLPSFVCLLLTIVALSSPRYGVIGHALQIVVVFVANPLLVLLGASALERRPKIGSLLGDASYAVYAIHHPIITGIAAATPFLFRTHQRLSELTFIGAVTMLAIALARADESLRGRIMSAMKRPQFRATHVP